MVHDFFELFGLPRVFGLDTARLDNAYRQLQAEVHPDRFATASDTERRQSLQWATHVNEAYQTLKDPLLRARYLLHLNGIDTLEESNTAMPAAFLMRQMEWREAIEEAQRATDMDALENLSCELQQEIRTLQSDLSVMLDQQEDYATASDTVRKLRFLDKVHAEINLAIEAME